MSDPITRLHLPRVLTPQQASHLVGEMATEREPSPLAPGTVVHDADTGAAVLAYLPLEEPARLRAAAMSVDFDKCTLGRQKNYRSRTRTFGFAPRRPVVRREGCTLAAIAHEQPDVERVLESYADQFSAALELIDPDIVPKDQATLGDVLPDWRMGEAKLWTSGVVNDTAQLPYHRDGFNFATWSAMPVVRRGVRGGHLHLPEYDLTVPCMDSTVTFFPGYTYVHGVTPMRKATADGYRISIVYYALKGMKNCREAAEETRYARTRRTEREADMARRLAAGDKEIPR